MSQAIREKRISSRELVEDAIQTIEEIDLFIMLLSQNSMKLP